MKNPAPSSETIPHEHGRAGERQRAQALDATAAAMLEALLPQPCTQDMADLSLALQAGLIGEGMPAAEAARLAAAQARHLSVQLGGQQFYIPRGWMARCAERDRRILEAFDGRNYHKLARRFGITVQRVRNIVAKERQRAREAAHSAPTV